MLILGQGPLTLHDIESVALHRVPISLAPEAIKRVNDSRQLVEQILTSGDRVYGINTGFGRLADVSISDDEVEALQLNLVRSHSVGVGEPLSQEETRAMMLLRISSLAHGLSGIKPETLQFLIDMVNRNVVPVIPSQGSVGASGDLAPLAHMSLPLIGEGECWQGDDRIASKQALEQAGLAPITLGSKEGLALLNGTQAICSVGSLAMVKALRCLSFANLCAATTLEALLGTPAAYDLRIHQARPHPGQIDVARQLIEHLSGSEIRESHRQNDPRVQDAYCLRCVPQVHGSVTDTLAYVQTKLETEAVSGTDNPLVFTDTGEVISGGNFHGAPLAHALDYAAIALTDLLSISERRLDRLVNPDSNEGLPPFLSPDAGLGSGYMMAHVTVAALLNECKVLSHPASIDSVPTSGGKEDHVSMGMTSALKFRKIVENVSRGLAIEFMAACEGIDYRKPLQPGVGVAQAHKTLRSMIPPMIEDRSLSYEIEMLAGKITTGEFA